MEVLSNSGICATLGAFLIVKLSLLHRPLQRTKYLLKSVLFVITLLTVTSVCLPIFCLNPWSVENGWYVWSGMTSISGWLGVRWEVRREKQDPEEEMGEEACVIVANHQSTLDIVGLGKVFETFKFVLVAKKELFYLWPVGLAGWLCGMVFIDRSKPDKATETINKASKIMKVDKTNMWFFPEGQRNKKNRSFLPFKKGAFRLAIQCQVPIQPIVFSPHYFLDESRRICESGKVIVSVLPPIPTAGLTMDDVDRLAVKTRAVMLTKYEAVYQEILEDKTLRITYNKLALS